MVYYQIVMFFICVFASLRESKSAKNIENRCLSYKQILISYLHVFMTKCCYLKPESVEMEDIFM